MASTPEADATSHLTVEHIMLSDTVKAAKPPVSELHVGMTGNSGGLCFDRTRGCLGGEEKTLVSFSERGGQVSRAACLVSAACPPHQPAVHSPARAARPGRRMLHARLLHGGVEIAVQQEEALAPVLFAMQALATFFLAAFISLVLQRWSTLRLNAVGNVYGAASNLCTLAGHVWAGTDSHSRAMRKRTLRYILLAFSLMFAEARREDDLQIYVDAAMLTREERFVLDALPRKAQAVAGWLLRHFHMDKFSKTASVQSETERKLLLEQIFRLRGMIADCHMCAHARLRAAPPPPPRRARATRRGALPRRDAAASRARASTRIGTWVCRSRCRTPPSSR